MQVEMDCVTFVLTQHNSFIKYVFGFELFRRLCLRFWFFFLPEAREHSYQWVPCTVHETHTTSNVHKLALLWHCQWVPWTVHGTHKSHFSTTFLLKMGPTALFTHLKIILVQCFQFSVSVTISSIQTDPKCVKWVGSGQPALLTGRVRVEGSWHDY